MKRPLQGIRVVEVASGACPLPLRIAMSFAGRMAVDLGATVVKVGLGADDPIHAVAPFVGTTSALGAFLDAGKTWQVASPSMFEIPTADTPDIVFCDDVVLASYGLGHHPAVKSVLSLNSSGAPAGMVSSEFTVMASTGLLDLVGDPDREPLRMGGHQLAYASGLSAYSGAIAALAERSKNELNAPGEVVRVPMADVGVWLNWKSVATSSWSSAGRVRLGRDAEWQVIRCADGWIALVFLEADWPVLRDFIDDERLREPRLDDRNERRRNARMVAAVIEERFQHLTRRQLKDLALSKRLPLGPVWTPLELEQDPQNLQRQFFSRVRDTRGASLLMPRLPILWNGRAFAALSAADAADTAGFQNRAGLPVESRGAAS